MLSAQSAIDDVLSDMRIALMGNKMQPVNRKKNLDTLAKKGWLWKDVMDELLNLCRTDYVSGPEVDRDDPLSDKFWIFKKQIDGELIYIKIKVLYQQDGRVKVVSFHIDEP